MKREDLPQRTLYFQRNEDGAWTNLPVLAVDKSNRGFEWGYHGSGPADLALNVLEWALLMRGYHGKRVRVLKGSVFLAAYLMHQEYKSQVIAQMPWIGGEITLEEVWTWIDNFKPDLSHLTDNQSKE